MEDENDKMDDLALNSDFDSSLLHCWDTGDSKNDNEDKIETKSRSQSPQSSPERDTSSWDGNCSPGFSRLPSFTMEDETGSQKSGSSSSYDKPSSIRNRSVNINDHRSNTQSSKATEFGTTDVIDKPEHQQPTWELLNQTTRLSNGNDNVSDSGTNGSNALRKCISDGTSTTDHDRKTSPATVSATASTASNNKDRKMGSSISSHSSSEKKREKVRQSRHVHNHHNHGHGRSHHHQKLRDHDSAHASGEHDTNNHLTLHQGTANVHGAHGRGPSNAMSQSVGMQNEQALTTTQLHPLAIPSSANCPPHIANNCPTMNVTGVGTSSGNPSSTPLHMQGGHDNSSGNGVPLFQITDLSSLGHNNTSFLNNSNGLTSSMQQLQQNHMQFMQFMQTPAVSSAVGLSGCGSDTMSQLTSNSTQHPQQQQPHHHHHHHHQQQISGGPVGTGGSTNSTDNNSSNTSIKTTTPIPATSTTNPAANNLQLPQYLFNAPLELRANFLQSQRMHGIPVTDDLNSYHYGVAVNGFHPEKCNTNAQMMNNNNNNNMNINNINMHNSNNDNNNMAPGGSSLNNEQSSSSTQLNDSTRSSTNRKSGRGKNEREQKRAQKITELIDQLREKMESGGWKVEMKSKFQTLASCAKYVKHLIKETEEKEKAVQKAKSDLEMKERKVEEEKALQESRSDPESVMSSLTSSTGGSNVAKVSKGNSEDSIISRKRKSSGHPTGGNESSNKKSKGDDSSGSSESSGEERTSRHHHGGHAKQSQNVFSVSDITDSNKDSSANQRSSDDDEESGFSSSRGSDAAVAEVADKKDKCAQHADVVIQGRNSERKHKSSNHSTTVTSLDATFELDYEEVFVKSNFPQVIATTAGRIVRWNEFFLKATGITKAEVKKLTIFSLVKADKLSNLFEIVAAALKKGSSMKSIAADLNNNNSSSISSSDSNKSYNNKEEGTSSNCGNEKGSDDGAASSSSSSSSSETNNKSQRQQPQWDYAAMTLPCIDFRSSKRNRDGNRTKGTNPLYITVTLMGDEDPRQRLFHCMFTDCPGTNGSLGSITPELLALHFTRWSRKCNDSAEARKSDKGNKHSHQKEQ